MKAERLEDIFNAHQTFAEQIQKFSRQTNEADFEQSDRKNRLQQYKTKLADLHQAKTDAIRRYDESIQRFSQEITRLENEINATNKRVEDV